MKMNRRVFRQVLVVAIALMLLAAAGCKSKSSSEQQTASTTTQTSSATSPLVRPIDGGTYCVQTISQGPPVAAPIHFSYKVTESDGSYKDQEADLAAQTFDLTIRERNPATDLDRQLSTVPGGIPITIRDGFAESSHTIHYTRADARGWAAGPNMMTLGTSPWALFVAKPISTQVGTENVSGFDTIKYAVDTTHQSQIEKSGAAAGWNVADYNITGTAWVTKDTACVLQYAIDLERDSRDGKVWKTHYEGGITKP